MKLIFDGGVEGTASLPGVNGGEVVQAIDPPVVSTSLRVEVVSVQGSINNGFDFIEVKSSFDRRGESHLILWIKPWGRETN